TPEEYAQAATEEVAIKPRLNNLLEVTAYFNEQVRRYLEERFGENLLYTGGLQVETSINLPMQQVARQAVKNNLRAHDKRQGYRGAQQVLDEVATEEFLTKQLELLTEDPLAIGSYAQAIVVGQEGDLLHCRIGDREGTFSIEKSKWAAPIEFIVATAETDIDIEPLGNIGEGKRTQFQFGSLIDVKVLDLKSETLKLSLEQAPLAQAALVAVDPFSGQIKAMVGGYDFKESQFNRAIQAKRLPGSAIKPIIYAAALDRGYTPASIILDTPLIYENKEVDTGKVEEWKPKNYEQKFYGPTRFRYALAHSRNVVTIKILEDIGVSYAANYAKKLGLETPLQRDLSMALGSTAITPLEMLTTYTVFANGGVLVPPTYITRIRDRNGRILESIDPADFATG
ncbi:MAG: penicillin-binding protein, partial [Desulfuromusa sp.]|nr:penicillin-binding protein [Desulfuromusa sp.]